MLRAGVGVAEACVLHCQLAAVELTRRSRILPFKPEVDDFFAELGVGGVCSGLRSALPGFRCTASVSVSGTSHQPGAADAAVATNEPTSAAENAVLINFKLQPRAAFFCAGPRRDLSVCPVDANCIEFP